MREFTMQISPLPRWLPAPIFLLCKYFIHSHTHEEEEKTHIHTRSTPINKWNNTEKKKTAEEENSGRKSWKTEKSLTLISLKKIK